MGENTENKGFEENRVNFEVTGNETTGNETTGNEGTSEILDFLEKTEVAEVKSNTEMQSYREPEQVKSTEVVEKNENDGGKKSKNPLIVAMLGIITVLLVVTICLVLLEMSGILGEKSAQASGNNVTNETVTPVPTVVEAAGDTLDKSGDTGEAQAEENVVENIGEYKRFGFGMADLEQEAAAANAAGLNGFTAFVEQIGGKQYLTFSNGVYKVSYKNETTPSPMSSIILYEVIISNGTKTETFYWDYYVESGNAAKLCPMIGDYCKNGREQLVFAFKEREDSKADTLHVVAGNTLMEYYVIAPENALANLIKVNGYLDAGRRVLADLTSDSRNYYISLPDCKLELAEEIYAVKADSHLTYEITEEDITLQSFVELGDGQYVGRIRGKIAFSSRDVFRLTSPSFYVFADDDYTDDDSMGICYPVAADKLDAVRIPVVGDNGERLLVHAREEIVLHDYDLENFRLDENGFLAYYENNVKKTLVGVDVSKWQYDIDWKKVAAAGVDYAIIRLGYRGTAAAGNCAMDPYFEQNMKGAMKNGLQVGVYYFTQAITVEEAIAEANIVIEALKGYDITFPVVYDTEYADNARANGLSNAERTACAKAFCDTVLAAGYTPVIYAGTNWSILDMNMEELQGYDLWYAYYGEAKDIYYPYNFTMWQYTDKGKVDGIPTDADLNISFVDYSTR